MPELSATVVTPVFGQASDGAETLTAALWQERELLERLLFALASQQALLDSRNMRWLVTANAQISDLIDALRDAELCRALIADRLLAERNLPQSASLTDLAASFAEPTATIQSDMLAVLVRLVDEVDEATRHNQDLLVALVRPRSPNGLTT